MNSPLRKILSRWPIIAISTLLCLALAVATLPKPPAKAKGPQTYHAQVTLGPVNESSTPTKGGKGGGSGGGASGGGSGSKPAAVQSAISAKLMEHYLALAISPATMALAARILGGKVTAKKMASEVGVEPNKLGDLLIKSRDHTAAKAAAAANAFAKAMIQAATRDQATNQQQQEANIRQQLNLLASQIKSLEAASAPPTTTATTTPPTTTPPTTAAPTTTVAPTSKTHKGARAAGHSTQPSHTTTPPSRSSTRPSHTAAAGGGSGGKKTATTAPKSNLNTVSLNTALGLYTTLYRSLLQTETRNVSKAPLQVIAVKKPGVTKSTTKSPIRKRYWLAGGLMLGLALGLLIAALLALMDRGVADESRAEELMGMPVLAYIPRSSGRSRPDDGPEVVDRPISPVAESYRRLATALEQAPAQMVESAIVPAASAVEGRAAVGGSRRSDGARQVLGLVGARPRAGCSTVVANLAATLSEFGFAPFVVDANLRYPLQHVLFGVPAEPGITDGVGPLSAPTSPLAPGVRIIPAGREVSNPSAAIQQLVTDLPEWRHHVQLALVDIADLATASDAAILARELDAIVLVCSRRNLTKKSGPTILRDLSRVATPVLGMVLVEARSRRFLSRFSGPQLRVGAPWRSAKGRAEPAQPTDVDAADDETVDLTSEQERPATEEHAAADSNGGYGRADEAESFPGHGADAPAEASWRRT